MKVLGRIGLALAFLTLTAARAGPAPDPSRVPPVTAADRVIGRADAPVTIVEYGSFACIHCADWHQMVYPEFKRRLIDTGKVRYVFRNLPTPPEEMSLPAAALAHCAVPARFFDVAVSLMHGQDAVRYGGTLDVWFNNAVAVSGKTRAQIDACVATPATRAAINADISGADAANIHTTPTFIVNGRIATDRSLGGLETAVRAADGR